MGGRGAASMQPGPQSCSESPASSIHSPQSRSTLFGPWVPLGFRVNDGF